MESSGDTQRLENALAIYDEGLERYPDNTELRSNRANLLAGLGRDEEAKRDLDELHEGGLHKGEMLLRRMVHERLEGATDDALACYAEVEAAYVMAGEPDAPRRPTTSWQPVWPARPMPKRYCWHGRPATPRWKTRY